MGLAPTHPGASLPFFCHNGDHHLSQPPPAHMGIPPYQLDAKSGAMGDYWRGIGLGLAAAAAGGTHPSPVSTASSSSVSVPPPPPVPPHLRGMQSTVPSAGRASASPHQQAHQQAVAAAAAAAAAAAVSSTPSPRLCASRSPPGMGGLSPGEWKRLGPLLAASGLTRAPMYSFTAGQYPYPMLSPEMSQVAASWHTPSMYPISSAGAGFRSPYPSSLPITSTSLPSDFYRFSPNLIPPHPGLSPHHALASHPAIVTPGPKQELTSSEQPSNHSVCRRSSNMEQKSSGSTTSEGNKSQESTGQGNNNQAGVSIADKKKPHIKKPLNAFMLYMKEMRAKVVAECTLKESAAINQILGRRKLAIIFREFGNKDCNMCMISKHAVGGYDSISSGKQIQMETSILTGLQFCLVAQFEPGGAGQWHALGREEQAKYYELARRERQLHMQLYPDWSSRSNATRGKKRKRKQETNDGGSNMKKCRARYGLDQQSQWCKPCSPAEGSISSGSGAAAGALHSGATGVGPTGTNSGVISPQEPTYRSLTKLNLEECNAQLYAGRENHF
ncbi:hypothetical protein B566_EDAN008285 [Ephemera danica]|nr:hypothetical protein B566_EDAN008285 [Ephemera danica]